jgi:hypothetical protein
VKGDIEMFELDQLVSFSLNGKETLAHIVDMEVMTNGETRYYLCEVGKHPRNGVYGMFGNAITAQRGVEA